LAKDYEETSAPEPPSSQSIERYPKGSNGQDTDDNSKDFFIQENPNPQGVYGLWLDGWDKRKLLVIDNKENTNNLTDYQVKINVNYQSEMQSDFSDIRFTSSNGQTLLPYYREEYTKDTSAVFWVKIPSIPAYSEVIIFQYYGNNGINNDDIVYGDCNKNGGCGENVFVWFDNFSTNRSLEYNQGGTVGWDTKKGYVKFFRSPRGVDYGYISPKNLEIKNFYIKTKMRLGSGVPAFARQAFIDYRHSDNNTITTDSLDDDDYLKFGINNKSTAYKGLRFDKNINTESIGQATNILKYDAATANYFDIWGVYEVRAYETNHQFNFEFEDEDLTKTTWNVNNNYLDQTGKIYLRGDDIGVDSWVWVDYLMIGQSTLPEPTVVTDKLEGYTAIKGQVRNLYPLLNWDKRKLLVIDNKQNSNALTDYQIKIDVNYQSEMQSDFSDIRFTSSDGQSLLPYYREEYTKEKTAVFWIKVPSIPAYSEVIIYQYYDNVSATYEGNGEDVFVWFDDFSTNRSLEYNQGGTVRWDTEKGYVRFSNPYGFISPKDPEDVNKSLKMKNLYIKTKMYLEKETDSYHTNMARQAFIDYRHSDNNTVSTDSLDDDDYLKFGINNTLRNNADRGLRFDKNINTEDVDQATNILKIDESLTLTNYFDKWGIYEVRAYETNHQVDFVDEDLKRTTWNTTSHYLYQKGKIYLRALDVSSTTSWVWVDYLMIGQSTLPEPVIVTDESEGYIATKGQARNSYPDFPDWGNKKTIMITNKITETSNATSTTDIVDYPIKIEINYLIGMNKDFSDTRFVDSDKPGIALKYWNESYSTDSDGNPTSAVFWVKVPKIPGTVSSGSGEKTIYMYYNNPSATYIGNGEDVFAWFDDFSTNRSLEYNQGGNVGWDTKKGHVKFFYNTSANYGYISPKDPEDADKSLEMKDLYIKTKMFLERETAGSLTEFARQGLVDYRHQNDDNYWRFGLNHKNAYTYKGVIFGSNEEGNPFFRPLMKQSFYDKWGTFEIKAADNNHEARFVDANGQDWIAGGTGLNQKGNIYLRGSNIKGYSWVKFDYLIISKYNPEIKVSDVY